MLPSASAVTPSPIDPMPPIPELRAETCSGDEVPDLSRAGTPDPQSLPPAGIVVVVGLGIDGIENVIVIDEEPTDPAELVPGVEVRPLLIEDLDPAIAPVGHEQASLRVHGEGVGGPELAIPVSELGQSS